MTALDVKVLLELTAGRLCAARLSKAVIRRVKLSKKRSQISAKP